ncbi:hypothetical protein E0H22_15675 [Rhodopseudomonas boonkerdii]|uniref:hypothetical protein n=1 Tax=Rhodopseudomonas boonkerdii TaxID=475937 RepID=UPI001E2BFDEA|nr:hypothetical protein [Rhodopseudomonas boonkerdii]UGV27002.1 hypothetical protein E0H22_15675 [Rhodopseudomonas boonkerdii]
MLTSTKEERRSVEEYFLWQSPEATISFLQKVYCETVAGHRHDVWDVHASDGRWWIITNPTNLYSQTQFPNMDYAVTFHLGLCLRIPRTDSENKADAFFTPFSAVLNELNVLPDALGQAKSLSDYQGIGVKCRELLLSFVGAAQDAINWSVEKPPQRANFRAWIDIIFDTVLGGQAQQERRRLFKSLFNEAWTFSNWLTHTKSATWHDAEAAQTTIDHAIGFGTSLLLRVIRLVPEECPKCGSPDIAPQESRPAERPNTVWQRPACRDCDWTGLPVRVDPKASSLPLIKREGREDTGECIVPNVPLTKLAHPRNADE